MTAAAGLALTRASAAADAIVVCHAPSARVLCDDGELRLGLRLKPGARLASEGAFRRRLGLEAAPAPGGPYSEDQMIRHAGLSRAQLGALALFDVVAPVDGRYAYADLVAARAVGQLLSSGARLQRIVAAALELERRGERLSSVRLAEAPWGAVLQVVEGALADMDGQLLLPLEGSDLDADGAFALAEAAEREGDLASARRWYELAVRLDPTDPILPFNLGNVLDELGLAREAEFAYRRAIARATDMADAWFNLGVLQEKTGREAEALGSYERAFAIDPTYADALHNAALLHMRSGRFTAAAGLLEQIGAASPADATEIRRLAHLCRVAATNDGRPG
ncbi:tetratricopeptide repeat protein [Roseiarcus fermentans]|uniref:Tetratricopeptide repeat protein n=1 Tax=Roseiarcus fermentans TaxID=1473586 RepID=A0A366FAT0_9HYPH|nr:tetratricopeptide repeat protein [Roseiarcus fermentans]